MSGKKYYTDSNRVTHLIKKRVRVDANGNVHIIKACEYEGHNVYSSSHVVKYHIDINNVVDVEVDDGGNAIAVAPTATKSGYTLVGWRENDTASSSVLPSKTITTDGVHLYAVFKQTITVSLVGGTSTVTNTGTKYYNNGDTVYPSITLGTSQLSGWTLVGYRNDDTASTSVSYVAGQAYTFTASKTIYAVFNRTISVSYNANGGTGSMAPSSGTQIYNNGYYDNPYVTISSNGFTRPDYSFDYWNLGSTSGTGVNAGASIQISDNITAYAHWSYIATRSFSVTEQQVASAYNTFYTSDIQFTSFSIEIRSPYGTGISTAGYKLKVGNNEYRFSGGGGGSTPITCSAIGSWGSGTTFQILNENLQPQAYYYGNINGTISN